MPSTVRPGLDEGDRQWQAYVAEADDGHSTILTQRVPPRVARWGLRPKDSRESGDGLATRQSGRASSQASTIAAIRSPAWPSHSGGPSAGTGKPSASTRRTHATTRVGLQQRVRAVGDRDRPFRVGPDGQARDARARSSPPGSRPNRSRPWRRRGPATGSPRTRAARRSGAGRPSTRPAASRVGPAARDGAARPAAPGRSPRAASSRSARPGRDRPRWPADASSPPRRTLGQVERRPHRARRRSGRGWPGACRSSGCRRGGCGRPGRRSRSGCRCPRARSRTAGRSAGP